MLPLISLLTSLTISPISAQASSLLSCRTENGLELVVNTDGRESGVAIYGDGKQIWDLAPDEYVSLELLHGSPCHRLELRKIFFDGTRGKLQALCLNPGNTYYFDVSLSCKPLR